MDGLGVAWWASRIGKRYRSRAYVLLLRLRWRPSGRRISVEEPWVAVVVTESGRMIFLVNAICMEEKVV